MPIVRIQPAAGALYTAKAVARSGGGMQEWSQDYRKAVADTVITIAGTSASMNYNIVFHSGLFAAGGPLVQGPSHLTAGLLVPLA